MSSPLQQLRTELKDKRMIVSKDQIHLTSTVGHGKHLSQTVIVLLQLGKPLHDYHIRVEKLYIW